MIESSHTLVALMPYILSLALAASLGIYGLMRRKVWGVLYFCAICFSQFLWIGGYLLELVFPSMEAKIFWDNFQWFGTSMSVFSILALAFYSVDNALASSKIFWSVAVVMSTAIGVPLGLLSFVYVVLPVLSA